VDFSRSRFYSHLGADRGYTLQESHIKIEIESEGSDRHGLIAVEWEFVGDPPDVTISRRNG
jgi:hypothetical protein